MAARKGSGPLPGPPKDKSKLRTGFTTGACSAAATKAAVLALVTQRPTEQVTIKLPSTTHPTATFVVEKCEQASDFAYAEVRKDAGDDPDCTDKALLCARVVWSEKPGVEIEGGDGVGRITRPGLGLDVGSAAINPVPRKMIFYCATEAMQETGQSGARGLQVTISVPGGQEMAKQTLNARLGIIGGISILGRTGIVKPYSTAAFRASVEQSIDVAKAQGVDEVVITTGGRSERFAMMIRKNEGTALPEAAYIQMGDFTGASLKRAMKNGLRKVTVCGMIGKFSKIAAGVMQTHAAGSQVDMEFLAQVAKDVGADEETLAEIRAANTGRHVGEITEARGLRGFYDRLCEDVCRTCRGHIKDQLAIEAILTDFEEGKVLGRAVME